jgi:uncharacterized protein (TIGR00251 family)
LADALLSVRVIPRARRSSIDGMRGDAWLIRLQAPPVDGAANEALIAVIATACGVARRAVSIVAGQTSRNKRVRLTGLDEATVRARLLAAKDD